MKTSYINSMPVSILFIPGTCNQKHDQY